MKEKIIYNEIYNMDALMEYLDSEEGVAMRNHIKETLSLDEMVKLMLANEGVVTEEREEEPDYLKSQSDKEVTNLNPKHSLLSRLAARKQTP